MARHETLSHANNLRVAIGQWLRRSRRFSVMILASLLLAVYAPVSVMFGSSVVYAANCDPDFYASNDILWYDGCASACNTTTGQFTDSSENAEAMFKYLTGTVFDVLGGPMNATQAAGFLGNAYIESKYDPAAIQAGKEFNERYAYDSSTGGYAFGLFQWDTGRRVALLTYAQKQGKSWSDLALQMDYLKSELEGSESAILKDNQFKTTTSVDVAAERVAAVFERPGSKDYHDRVVAANAAYGKYSSLAPSASVTGACPGAGGGNGDIASTATLLSWSKRSSETNDHTSKQNMPEYDAALKATGVDKLGDSCSKAGISCDAFLATVMRYSGVDTNFPCCGADAQGAYLQKHTEIYQEVSSNVTSTKELQPGDILWGPGHVKIYIGDGKEAAASHCERTGEQSPIYLTDRTYHAFRVAK